MCHPREKPPPGALRPSHPGPSGFLQLDKGLGDRRTEGKESAHGWDRGVCLQAARTGVAEQVGCLVRGQPSRPPATSLILHVWSWHLGCRAKREDTVSHPPGAHTLPWKKQLPSLFLPACSMASLPWTVRVMKCFGLIRPLSATL